MPSYRDGADHCEKTIFEQWSAQSWHKDALMHKIYLMELYASLTAIASWSAQDVGFMPQRFPFNLLSI